jgi:hypothetical protein
MAPKSKEFHAVLDLLDRGQGNVAGARLWEWTAAGKIGEQEFRLLLNAFTRRDVEVTTA